MATLPPRIARRQSRRGILLAGAALCAGMPAIAQPQGSSARVYAAMSFVADYLTVTGFESTTGSLVRSNPTERIELPTDELERAVLRAAVTAVQEARGEKALALVSDDGRLYSGQSNLVVGSEARLPGFLLETLNAQKATHLLLTTKYDGPARMRAADQDLGSGNVQGLGFYIDRVTALRMLGTSQNAVGYLAPHVYLRLSLIDIQARRVLGTRTVTASRVVTAIGTNAGANPWDVMDTAAKVKALSELIAQGVTPMWRELLAP